MCNSVNFTVYLVWKHMSKLRYALELVRDVLTEQLGKVLCMT